jgi:DNA-binding NarL/FixJ family response regulator
MKRPAEAAARRRNIIVVDDHPMMRAGLTQLIDRQPDLQVSGEAGNPVEVFSLLRHRTPDLLLTDLNMPGRAGIEFLKDVLALSPGLPILVISMHDELLYAERCLRAGARGYLMKESGSENLLLGLRRVLAGQIHVSDRVSDGILQSITAHQPRGTASPIRKLSDREFEILQLLGHGKTTREIAGQLHLSPKTVDVHRSRIKEKLGIKTAPALVRYAVHMLAAKNSSP